VPVQFTVVFSEAVTGFTAADVCLAGSTAPGPLVVAVSGSGTTYTVTVSYLTGAGTVVLPWSPARPRMRPPTPASPPPEPTTVSPSWAR
jgi:hypothetical protein